MKVFTAAACMDAASNKRESTSERTNEGKYRTRKN